jgi:transmembrane sensor
MDSKQIEREASDWLARQDSGRWGAADDQAFATWQEQSTAHRIAVIRLKTVWRRAERLQALGAGIPRGQIPAPKTWGFSPAAERDPFRPAIAPHLGATPHSPRRVRLLAALAATVAVLAFGAGTVGYLRFHDPNAYRSQIGAIEIVSLADGSKVTLNTNSAIHVALSDVERRIDLTEGEAFFEVAKDPRRPFVVSAGGRLIVAVGTKFSVFRRAQDTRVVVTEGRVKVEDLHGSAPSGPATDLPAGSIARAGSAGVLVNHATVAEAETYMSWRSGYISLHDTKLAVAVAEFNRYNTKQLVIADPAIAELQIGGNLRAQNVEAFVRVLEEGFPVRAHEEGDRIILRAK